MKTFDLETTVRPSRRTQILDRFVVRYCVQCEPRLFLYTATDRKTENGHTAMLVDDRRKRIRPSGIGRDGKIVRVTYASGSSRAFTFRFSRHRTVSY